MAALQDETRLNDSQLSPFRQHLREVLFPWSVLPPKQRAFLAGGPFELLMIVVYLCNMVVLALPDTSDLDDSTRRSIVLRYFDLVFSSLYLMEIFLRMICFGTSIYKHPIRFMDLALVCTNFSLTILFFLGVPNTNFSLLSLRCCLRVLRPFFITTTFPAVRLFVVSVTQSVMQLTDVFLFYVLFLMWFGVAGVYQYNGLISARCVNELYLIRSVDMADGAAISIDEATGDPILEYAAYSSYVTHLHELDAEAALLVQFPMIHLPFNSTSLEQALIAANGTTIGINPQNPGIRTVSPEAVSWEAFPDEHKLLTSEQNEILHNITEHMVKVAVVSFMRSFVRSRDLELEEFVCGSEYLEEETFIDDLEHILLGAPPPGYCPLCPAEDEDDDAPSRGTASLSHTRTVSFGNTSVEPPKPSSDEESVTWSGNVTAMQLFEIFHTRYSLWPSRSCTPGQSCDLTWHGETLRGFRCPYAYECTPNVELMYEWVGFDHIGMAIQSIFACAGFQLWHELIFVARDTSDEFSYIYFILILIVGTYMIVNLTIVVLTVEFEKARIAEMTRMRTGGQVQEKTFDSAGPKPAFLLVVEQATARARAETIAKAKGAQTDAGVCAEGGAQTDAKQRGNPDPTLGFAISGLEGMTVTTTGDMEHGLAHDTSAEEMKDVSAAPTPQAPVEQLDGTGIHEGSTTTKEAEERMSEASDDDLNEEQKEIRRRIAVINGQLAVEEHPILRLVLHVRLFAKVNIVETKWFKLSNFIIVLANVIILCYHHHGMKQHVIDAFETCNLVFAIYFTMEALVRFLAESPQQFAANAFNVFDVIIVAASWVELMQISTYITSLSRSVRIMRGVKLLKAFPALYQWIAFILAAAKASPMLVLMLLLQMFIFSSLCMQLFGGRLCGLDDEDNPPEESMVHYMVLLPPDLTSLYDYSPPLWNCTIPHLNATGNITDAAAAAAVVAACSQFAMTNLSATPLPGVPDVFGIPHTVPTVDAVPRELDSVERVLKVPSAFYGDYCEELPGANFDSFDVAMVTSFLILTGDDWDFVMYDCMTARGGWAAVPFIIYFYFGAYIMLNILLAILMSANVKEETEENLEEALEEEQKLLKQKEELEALERREEEEEEQRRKLLYGANDDDSGGSAASSDNEDDKAGDARRQKAQQNYYVLKSGKIKIKSRSSRMLDNVFKHWDTSRKYIRKLVEHRIWQVLMALVIIFGSICMGLEDPNAAPDVPMMRALRTIDIVVTSIYIVEVLLNCRAYGILRRRTSYLRRDSWNVLDFVLVVISIIGIAVANLRDNLAIRILKVLRALRPLRLIKQSPGMRIVLSAITNAIPALGSVLAVTTSIFVMWAVVGVSLYSGMLQSCFVEDEHYPHFTLEQCEMVGGTWMNEEENFDNLGSAMLLIFIVATLENWGDHMFRVMHAAPYGQPQKFYNSRTAMYYFLLAAVFLGLFLTGIFASVLIDAYNSQKRRVSFQRSLLITREQEAWILTNKRIARFLPIKRALKEAERAEQQAQFLELSLRDKASVSFRTLRVVVRKVVHSRKFTIFINLAILINFVAMATIHYPEKVKIEGVVTFIDVLCTFIMTGEAALKIFAEGWRVYASSKWNKLDLFVVIVSVASYASRSVFDPRSVALFSSLRTIRLARMTRGYLQIDKLIAKLGLALVSLSHVLAFTALIFFIFAVGGMKLFGRLMQAPFQEHRGVDRHNNFASLGSAMLVLLRMQSGGDWPDIYSSCAEEPPFCDLDIGACPPEAPVPQLYFVIFLFISMYVLKNLLIAVLLDSFESSGQNLAIAKRDAQFFYRSWKHFDPQESLTIAPFDVLPFIRGLPKGCALGFNSKVKRKRVSLEFQYLVNLNLTSLKRPVPLATVIDTLTKMAFIVPPPENCSFLVEQQGLEETMMRSIATLGSPLTTHVKSFASALSFENIHKVGSTMARGLQEIGNTLEENLLLTDEERAKQERRVARQAEREERAKRAAAASPTSTNADEATMFDPPSPDMVRELAALPSPTTPNEGAAMPTGSFSNNFANNASFSPTEGEVGAARPPIESELMFFGETDELLTPHEIHSRCAALIMLNAVVKRAKDRLQKRAMKARARRLLTELSASAVLVPAQRGARRSNARQRPRGHRSASSHLGSDRSDSDVSRSRSSISHSSTSSTVLSGEWVRVKNGVVVERICNGKRQVSAGDTVCVDWASPTIPNESVAPPTSHQGGTSSQVSSLQKVWNWRPEPLEVDPSHQHTVLSSRTHPDEELDAHSADENGSVVVGESPSHEVPSSTSTHPAIPRCLATACSAFCANPFYSIQVASARERCIESVLKEEVCAIMDEEAPEAMRLFLANVPSGHMNGIVKRLTALSDALASVHRACRDCTHHFKSSSGLSGAPTPTINGEVRDALLTRLFVAACFSSNFCAQVTNAVLDSESVVEALHSPSCPAALMPSPDDVTFSSDHDNQIVAAVQQCLPKPDQVVTTATLQRLCSLMAADAQHHQSAKRSAQQRVEHLKGEVASGRCAAVVSVSHGVPSITTTPFAEEAETFAAAEWAELRSLFRHAREHLCDTKVHASSPANGGESPTRRERRPGWDGTRNNNNNANSGDAALHLTQLHSAISAASTLGEWAAVKRFIAVLDAAIALWPAIAQKAPVLPLGASATSIADEVVCRIRARANELRNLLIDIAVNDNSAFSIVGSECAFAVDQIINSVGDDKGELRIGLHSTLTSAVASAWKAQVKKRTTELSAASAHDSQRGASIVTDDDSAVSPRPLVTPSAFSLDSCTSPPSRAHQRTERGRSSGDEFAAGVMASALRRTRDVVNEHLGTAGNKVRRAVRDLASRCGSATTVVMNEDDQRVVQLFATFSQLSRNALEGETENEEAHLNELLGITDSISNRVEQAQHRNLMIGVCSLAQFRDALHNDEKVLRRRLEDQIFHAVVQPATWLTLQSVRRELHLAVCAGAVDAELARVCDSRASSQLTSALHSAEAELAKISEHCGTVEKQLADVQLRVRVLRSLQLPLDVVVPLQLVDLLWQMERKVIAVCEARRVPVPDNTPLRGLCSAARVSNTALRRVLDLISNPGIIPPTSMPALTRSLIHLAATITDTQVFIRDVLLATASAQVPKRRAPTQPGSMMSAVTSSMASFVPSIFRSGPPQNSSGAGKPTPATAIGRSSPMAPRRRLADDSLL